MSSSWAQSSQWAAAIFSPLKKKKKKKPPPIAAYISGGGSMGKWVKVHPREEKQVGRRFNLLPQHRKWLPAGSGEPPDLHHLVSRSRRTPSGERGEERSDSVPPWVFFNFIYFFVFIFCFPRSAGAGGGGGAALPPLLLQQQETMWGQGLQGLKVTNLLGFL